MTLAIAVALVSLTVLVFLRSASAALIPVVAIPVSLLGTCGVMYLLGYSLDVLSLMAPTVSTGFVVDDAIVVLENVSRHMEAGMPRGQAALRGAEEVGFTIISISLSLIAVFLPILFAGGIAGRLLWRFLVARLPSTSIIKTSRSQRRSRSTSLPAGHCPRPPLSIGLPRRYRRRPTSSAGSPQVPWPLYNPQPTSSC